RRAERTVLSGRDRPETAGAITPGTPARRSSQLARRSSQLAGQWWSRGNGLRRVAWPALAIAAALCIALFDTQPKPAEKQAAQTHAPRGETSIGALPSSERDREKPKDAELQNEKEELAAKNAAPQYGAV